MLLLVLSLPGLLADSALGEEYDLDSLRLGARYLRWQAAGGGSAIAAPTPGATAAPSAG